jgi:hypothetical protein
LEEEGRIRITVDNKAKSGGKFRLEGVWGCPPLKKYYWEEEGGFIHLCMRGKIARLCVVRRG